MSDEYISEKTKAVAQLVALAKTELEAGRIAKGTRLLKEAIERAADLEKPVAASSVQSAIEHSTVVNDLRAIYGLGGIRRTNSAARRS
jgi:hypothetical protein